MSNSTMLLESNSIPVPVQLAQKLAEEHKSWGVSAAVFVQQLHYWTLKESGELIDGKRWIYNSYEKWREQLCWLTDYGFRKVKQLLIDAGIILVQQLGLRQEGRDRSCWYALNYEHEWLKPLQDAHPLNYSTDGQVDCATDASVNCATDHIESEITPENTSDIEAQEEKSFPQEEKENRLTPEQLIEKYYDQLKIYRINPLIWRDETLVENPLFKPVLTALAKVPPLVAERGIQSFLSWMRSATDSQVESIYKDRYKALIAYIRKW